MNTKYRIVTDAYRGYEVQVRRWWLPFWFQCNADMLLGGNTFESVGEAELYVIGRLSEDYKRLSSGRVVKEFP